ncbi:hypothetical protein CLOM_g11602 [Closterium sp. NIES-68]|nr:hypothetical protein CLOM_g11602 [Closterium sp. NIES-68]
MRQQSHVAELERRIREGEEERERTRAALARSVEEGRRLERMIAAGEAPQEVAAAPPGAAAAVAAANVLTHASCTYLSHRNKMRLSNYGSQSTWPSSSRQLVQSFLLPTEQQEAPLSSRCGSRSTWCSSGWSCCWLSSEGPACISTRISSAAHPMFPSPAVTEHISTHAMR